jgi:flagellar basal-body rod modification protein FlgD
MVNSTLGGVTGSSSSAGVNLTPKSKNEQIGKNEFLTLLVTQLKNQDPEAPLDSKEFAVQLAQFTQVEKLISIDDKLTAQSDAATMGSMAGYLGHQVVLGGSEVAVQSGQGGSLQVDFPRDAGQVTVQLLNSKGAVVGQKEFGAFKTGKQVLSLDDLAVADGTYKARVVAANAYGGGSFEPSVAAMGVVTGFIPGPSPKLIVNGREVSVAEVRAVNVNPLKT